MSESVELVCPHCQAINRVPAARLGDAPQCGQCHQPVLPPHPVELTQPSFERFITRNQLPVLVDFWAPWCGPCKMFAPVFAQMAGTYASRVRFAKVNTEVEQGIAAGPVTGLAGASRTLIPGVSTGRLRRGRCRGPGFRSGCWTSGKPGAGCPPGRYAVCQ